MWRTAALLVCAWATLGIVSCGGGEKSVSEEEIEEAQALVASFKRDLQAALGEGLSGGVGKAIDVCRIQAPEIAASLTADGVSLGRTSHRLRNPSNAPDPWMEPLLADYLEKGNDRTSRAIRLADGSFGYVEPIYVQPMCLTCHGAGIDPSIAERLDAVYPGDNGRGFEEGDFRGLFWVRIVSAR